MTVAEFVNKYNVRKDKDKLPFLSDRIKRAYTPLKDKVTLCKQIVQMSSGDSILQYVLYTLMLVAQYTDINIDYTDSNGKFIADAEYDRLQSSGVTEFIIGLISENEIAEFNFIMGCVSEEDGEHLGNWSVVPNLIAKANGGKSDGIA